jgi:regulator of sigma E protease
MLDGGHLMILSVEAVVRRSLSVRQKEVLQQVGFAFLIFLMIYVTFGDISRIFGWFN